MDSGFYAVCTALMSRMQALDSVANNLANASTSGYRAQASNFQSVFTGLVRGTELNSAVNAYGVMGSTRLDLSQGGLERTGSETDFGLQGQGFFAVQTASGTAYTRDGSFHISAKGQLVTRDGDPVLGENGPITVAGGPLNASADGTLSVNGAVLGKLKIVDFPKGTQIQALGKNYYQAPAASAVTATGTEVRQGTLESSNVNPVQAAVELVNVQRSAEMMQRTLSIFHTEFNKTAAEDLPRVG
jgi:flagellar basal-body rod protein FlgF